MKPNSGYRWVRENRMMMAGVNANKVWSNEDEEALTDEMDGAFVVEE